jgi:hypothetical protein
MITVSNTAAKQNQKTKVFVGRARRQRSLRLATIHLRRIDFAPAVYRGEFTASACRSGPDLKHRQEANANPTPSQFRIAERG